jgi:hypothetical protein
MLVITVILVITGLISYSSYILPLNHCLGYVYSVSLLLTKSQEFAQEINSAIFRLVSICLISFVFTCMLMLYVIVKC